MLKVKIANDDDDDEDDDFKNLDVVSIKPGADVIGRQILELHYYAIF